MDLPLHPGRIDSTAGGGATAAPDLGDSGDTADVTVVELQYVARGLFAGSQSTAPLGLNALAAHYLGVRVSKQQQISDWGAKKLSGAQLTYAATDAWMGRQIFLEMQKRRSGM